MRSELLRFFHRFLLRLDPEFAHRIGILGLKILQCFRPQRKLWAPKLRISPVVSLAFSGRVGLAAGFDKNAEVFPALASLGFSFIEVGSVTPHPQRGNPRPRLWRLPPQALVNSLGFNNCGLTRFRENLLRLKLRVAGVPVFANLGKGRETPEDQAVGDYQKGYSALWDCVDGFVVNLSSPNTPGLMRLQNLAFLESLARILEKPLPVWVKLSPDLANEELKPIGEFVRSEKRFTGVVVTNTSRSLAQAKGFDRGGLSGEPLFERSLEVVSLMRDWLGPEKVLIGVGGINSLDRARKMRAAGADLLEIYTAFVYQGPSFVRELVEKLP